MANNFNIKKTQDTLLIDVSGSIDEEVTLSSDVLNGANTLIFDFKEVKGINSCGIREWIKWLSPFPKTKVVYRHCPKIIVDQINMVDGFLPATGKVESFFVPYYSDGTGEEKQVLFTLGKEYDDHGALHIPESVVDSKNEPMEIDVIESKYFRFIQKKQKAA
ncbi:MAG: hypothetical protein RJB66_2663 [Pseudomonadota bacterium]|jgi:hypothetical protein